MNFEQWDGFKPSKWQDEINVRDFIQQNYTLYEGDGGFSFRGDRANKPTDEAAQQPFADGTGIRRGIGYRYRHCFFPHKL